MTSLRYEPFPLVEISGTPRMRGLAYGRQAKQRIFKSIAHYKAQAERLGLSQETLSAIIEKYIPIVSSAGTPAGIFAPYLEEIQGIAEGSGATFQVIFLLNARTEGMKLAVQPELRAQLLSNEATDGCTAVTVMPSATASGHLIHAQNWDWKEECAETGVVLRILCDDGPSILTFTEAGMLARSGFNSAGIAITGNNLESDRDYKRIGLPLPMIRRKALECEHLALAMHVVHATPKSGSNNMAISHTKGVAINFECAPDETFQISPENGLLIHANHWISTAAQVKLRDTGIAQSPCTLFRGTRVRDILSPFIGSITIEHVKNALLDDFDSPWSVCRPPRGDLGRNTRSATVSTVVMEPARGVMEVANMTALNPNFTSYSLASN